MTERRDFDVEAALREVGEGLRYPATADLVAAVRARIAPSEPRGWLLGLRSPLQLAPALATLVLLVVATLAFQPVAGQAAEALGLRGIRLFPVPEVTAGPSADLLPPDTRRVGSVEEASREVGFRVRAPELLGEPEAIYVRAAEDPAMAFLFYGERTRIPAEGPRGAGTVTGARVLIVQTHGSLATEIMGKLIPPGTTVEEVEVNGGRGVWIEGEAHEFFYRAPNGDILTDTVRLAGNVLLWEQDGLLIRIEVPLSRDQALRIAGSLR